MTVLIKHFGEVLTSWPAGKEVYLMPKSYVFNNLTQDEEIIFDFVNGKVLTPS